MRSFDKKLFTFLLFFSLTAFSEEGLPYYDEVFFPDGRVRPQYADAYISYLKMSDVERGHFLRSTRQDFRGDNAVAPLPRLITASEFTRLKEGIIQRAEALKRFLEDHYSGRHAYRDRVIPGAEIDAITRRSGEQWFGEFITGERARRFRFLYGPDVIRDAEGTWRVLEDNPGYIGGPGDLLKVADTFATRAPQTSRLIMAQNDPDNFYNDLLDRYESLANPPIGAKKGEGVFVVYAVPPYSDNEDNRLHQILKERGAVLVTPNTKDKRLVVTDDGVHLETERPGGRRTRRKVGFLFLNAEHSFFEWNHAAIRERALILEAIAQLEEKRLTKTARREIEAALQRDPETRTLDWDRLERAIQKSNFLHGASARRASLVPGLLQAILDGRVQTNYSPGIEFIGDKKFNIYIEDLIRFYLHEEPILRNVRSRAFARVTARGKFVLDNKLLRDAMEHRERYVIKIVDGRGGDGVWIGPKTSERDWKGLKKKIAEDPSRFIVQDYTHPSVLGESIVDLRMVAMVDESGKPLVSGTPWGRSKPMDGDGKVNLSARGTETVVIVVPDPPVSCDGGYQKLAVGRR